MSKDCSNCPAFGKHCPHKVNGDPYFYDCYLTVAELEKENKELKCECRRCIHTDCPCVLSDYGKDRNGICDHFKDVFDENAELKSEKGCETCTKFDEVNLTKAKKIIKDLCGMVRELNKPNVQLTNIDYSLSEAKQFLKETE